MQIFIQAAWHAGQQKKKRGIHVPRTTMKEKPLGRGRQAEERWDEGQDYGIRCGGK